MSKVDLNDYRDRNLVLRCFMAAGDAPSPELVAIVPATFQAILADPHSSDRDKIRAAEAVLKLQQIQLAAVGQVNQIKNRRQARLADQLGRRDTDGPVTIGKSIADLIQQLEETQPGATDA